ncbi:MAG: heat-inducible transcription repressor HrcA [Nitriliruptoraceae bacterium]|nr:heat-inducible transcription repressor HrcA [Nitriliruptoraceae bacterium]
MPDEPDVTSTGRAGPPPGRPGGRVPDAAEVADAAQDAVRVQVELPGEPLPEDTTAAAPDDLDPRKLAVLRAVVTEYVANGEPVGSKRVVEVAKLEVSAATVRNEMAALEEAGYIAQPHTSAGRVPTDAGYRRFVDDLRANPALDAPRRELIEELLGSSADVEDLLARTSTVLSQLTRLVSLVIAPAIDASRLKLVELVALSPGAALLLMVADTGRVEKRSVELPAGTTDTDLERVRTMLGEHVRGRRLGEIHPTLAAIADEAPSDLREVLGALVDATAGDLDDDTVHHVFVGGQASLAGDEAFEREHLSRMLQLLEERATLARLLSDATADDEPTVRIGGENKVEDLRAASLVAQRYRLVTAGSLGVLGPTRMDYAGVLATVRAVADQLQETLTDLSR